MNRDQLRREVCRSAKLEPPLSKLEVARAIGCSTRTIERLVRLGVLKPVYLSAQRPYFPQEEVARYLKEGV